MSHLPRKRVTSGLAAPPLVTGRPQAAGRTARAPDGGMAGWPDGGMAISRRKPLPRQATFAPIPLERRRWPSLPRTETGWSRRLAAATHSGSGSGGPGPAGTVTHLRGARPAPRPGRRDGARSSGIIGGRAGAPGPARATHYGTRASMLAPSSASRRFLLPCSPGSAFFRQPATGNRQPATGNRQPATGNRPPATGNRSHGSQGAPPPGLDRNAAAWRLRRGGYGV